MGVVFWVFFEGDELLFFEGDELLFFYGDY